MKMTGIYGSVAQLVGLKLGGLILGGLKRWILVYFILLFLFRIMFLYLGNMYVLVISLLNKINQVSEEILYTF